ncbi:MAG: hypothetical protein ACE5GE_08595 [Phycisphaerae bacterium]
MDVTPWTISPLAPGLLGQFGFGLTNDQIARVALIMAVSGILLVLTRRRIRQAQNSPKTYAREQVSRLREERSLMSDIDELMAQLETVSRQLQARLDTKFAKLEKVIRDADARADRLERLLRRAADIPGLDLTVDDDTAPPASDPTPPADPHRAEIYRLTDEGLSPRQIAQKLDQTIGEVELILALKKASHTPVG